MTMNLDLFLNQTESTLKGGKTLGSATGSDDLRYAGSPPERQFLSVLVAAVALAKQQKAGRTDLSPMPDGDAVNTVPMSDESKMESLFSEAGSDWIELLDPASAEELVDGAEGKPSGELTVEMPDVDAVPDANGFVFPESNSDGHLVQPDKQPVSQRIDTVDINTNRQSFEGLSDNKNSHENRIYAGSKLSPGLESGLKQTNTPENDRVQPLTDSGQQPNRIFGGHVKNTDAAMPSGSVSGAPQKPEQNAEIRRSQAFVGEEKVRASSTAKPTGTAFADQPDRSAAEDPVRHHLQNTEDGFHRAQKPVYSSKVAQSPIQNDTPLDQRHITGDHTARVTELNEGREYTSSVAIDKKEGFEHIAANGDTEPDSAASDRVETKQTVFSRSQENQAVSVGPAHKAPATLSSQTVRGSEETSADSARHIGTQYPMREHIPTENRTATDPSVSTQAGSSGADFVRRIKEDQTGRPAVVQETTETGRTNPSRQDRVPVSKPADPADNISARAAAATADRNHEPTEDKGTTERYITASSIKGEPEAVRYRVETMNIGQSNTSTEFERVADARMMYGGNDRVLTDEAQVRQTVDNAESTDSTRLSADAEKYQKVLRLNQIVDKAALHFKNGASEVLIELKPEYLGRVRMQIAAENRQVIVKIMAELPAVREIIESDLSQLKSELQNQGVSVDKLDVSVFSESDKKDNPWQQADASRTGSDQNKRKKQSDDQNDPSASAAASRPDDRGHDNGISFFA